MEVIVCTIKLAGGESLAAVGTLQEVQATLAAGGFVQINDPWGHRVGVNTANVTSVIQLPGTIEVDDPE